MLFSKRNLMSGKSIPKIAYRHLSLQSKVSKYLYTNEKILNSSLHFRDNFCKFALIYVL